MKLKKESLVSSKMPDTAQRYNESMHINDTDSDKTDMTRQIERKGQRRKDGGGQVVIDAADNQLFSQEMIIKLNDAESQQQSSQIHEKVGRLHYEDFDDDNNPYQFDEPNLNEELSKLSFIRQGGNGRTKN